MSRLKSFKVAAGKARKTGVDGSISITYVNDDGDEVKMRKGLWSYDQKTFKGERDDEFGGGYGYAVIESFPGADQKKLVDAVNKVIRARGFTPVPPIKSL